MVTMFVHTKALNTFSSIQVLYIIIPRGILLNGLNGMMFQLIYFRSIILQKHVQNSIYYIGQNSLS